MRRAFSHVGIYMGDGKFIHSPRTGTTVQFWPDARSEDNPDGVFETGDFQFNILKARLREMFREHRLPGV